MSTDANLLHSLIDSHLYQFYWKDIHGVYLGLNARLKQKLRERGLCDDIIGKTDNDIFTSEAAKLFREHDRLIMKDKVEMLFEERIEIAENCHVLQLTIKKPLFNEEGIVSGIIGMTYDFTEIETPDFNVKLTPREIQCFSGLYLGHTSINISKQLGLSPKTVESYIANLKTKLCCESKHELIKFANKRHLSLLLIKVYENLSEEC